MGHTTVGYALVLFGLACAAFAGTVGLAGGLLRNRNVTRAVRWAIYGFSLALILSNLVMVHALLTHDFSVKYVAQVGSRATPTIFTIVSLWSALEGSILFWGAILGFYLGIFALRYRNEHQRYTTLTLGMMGVVATFFAVLIAGPANPWVHLANPPIDGPGPNPLLQNHILMIVHPPMLYLGYVGMVVPFAMASAALLRGELGDAWLEPLRRWTLVPWMFLSVGIILGGWWAYAVLGWGGYWSWDPVENASLMPWLTATAYLHSTMVLERRKSLKLWTIALVLACFLLTIIGTFMTRSGVFNSVHSFTQSDIGPTFLVFIAMILAFSIALLSLRGSLLVAESRVQSMLSREASILFNNLLLTALTFVVLLGTLYPLITEGLLDKKLTVGEPYFNQMAVPLVLGLLFLMGVGPSLPWGSADPKAAARRLMLPTALAVGGAIAGAAMGMRGFMPVLAVALAMFAATVSLRALSQPARERMRKNGDSILQALLHTARHARQRTGAHIIHLAIVIIVVAVAASRTLQIHETRTLQPGEVVALGNMQLRFDGLSTGREPHRSWISADVTLTHADGARTVHKAGAGPRMNFYERSTDPIGTPLVESELFRDVYVSMLAFDKTTGSASFNLWIFPLVGWLWYAIPFVVLGSLISLWPRRRKVAAPVPEASASASP